MGLVEDIKNQAKKSGANKKSFTYFKSGQKVRLRFLEDMEEGMKVLFHDGFKSGINEPCQEIFNRDCTHHEDEDLRHADQYLWSAWNHDSKCVELAMGRVNNCSFVPQLVGFYETYGTLTDRDYVFTKQGTGQNSSFSIVPMDKSKFRNDKAKPFSEKKKLELLDKAFPHDGDNDEDDDSDDKKEKDDKSYSDMTPKELYEECQNRGIDDVEKRKPAKYYIELLKADDDKDSEDDWKDEGKDIPDYESMPARELYNLCRDREIEAEARKPESYYIKRLEAYDREHADADDDGAGSGSDDEW